MINVSAI